MAYREVSRVEIAEVVRRWQSGESQRQIASGTGLSRKTVRRYIRAGVEAGLTRDGPVPTVDPPGGADPVQPSEGGDTDRGGPRPLGGPGLRVADGRSVAGDPHELLAARGCEVSYASVGRFMRRRGWQRRSATTVRMEESAPGEVAEMDFGRLGLIEDPEAGRRRAVWALIIVLTYSRHSFVWPTFSQKLVDVIEGLEAAWAFFEGVPKRQLPRSSGGCRSAPSPSHARLPGVLPAPGLHLRPCAGAPSPGQAARGAGGALRAGAVLQGRGVHMRSALGGGAWRWPDRGYTAPPAGRGRLPPGGAPARRVGRRALRDDRLAHGQGASRPSHSLPVRPLLGALCDMPTRAEGGGSARQQTGAHLPPGKASRSTRAD